MTIIGTGGLRTPRPGERRGRLPVLEIAAARGALVVIGPPSSGTRLVTAIIAESGAAVVHDPTHGQTVLPPGSKVVCVERDRAANAASIVARDDTPYFTAITTTDEAEQAIMDATSRINEAHPDAPVVRYEDLVADRDATVAALATALDVPPWPTGFVVTDENAKHDPDLPPDPPADAAPVVEAVPSPEASS